MIMAQRVDQNQEAIVQALRDIGASVYDTHSLGNGFPDIVVGLAGVNYLFEIKNPDRDLSRRSLTLHEERFRLGWSGQVETIETWHDAFKIMGVVKNG